MASTSVPSPDRQIQRRNLLGWGFELAPIASGVDLTRDLVLAPRTPGGARDLTTVEGIANLGQALTVALTTPLTGDVFNVDFGFDGLNAIAEETVPVLVQERIRVAVVTLLRKDPRIRRIVDVSLQDGRLSNPSNLRQLDVRVVFETVTGDQTTIDLGKVV